MPEPAQFEMHLPAQSTDEILRERLAAAVEAFNASGDPEERARLHVDIVRLRVIAKKGGGS